MKSIYFVFLFLLIAPLSFLNAGSEPTIQTTHSTETVLELPVEHQIQKKKRKAKRKKRRPNRTKQTGKGWRVMLILGIVALLLGTIFAIAVGMDSFVSSLVPAGVAVAIVGLIATIVGGAMMASSKKRAKPTTKTEKNVHQRQNISLGSPNSSSSTAYDLLENATEQKNDYTPVSTTYSKEAYSSLLHNYHNAKLDSLKETRREIFAQYDQLTNKDEEKIKKALSAEPQTSTHIADDHNLYSFKKYFSPDRARPQNLAEEEELLRDRIRVLSYRINRIERFKGK